MGLEEQVQGRLAEALSGLVRDGVLTQEQLRGVSVGVEPPRRGGSGHLATNAALALGRVAGRPPRELAERLAALLGADPLLERVEVAGPGFLNLTLHARAFGQVLRDVLQQGAAYGRGAAATRERVMVEFVSANPTGPLLISHGRGAVHGDVVARLLEWTGHRVAREYYVNDHGNQVRLLGASVLAAARGEEPPEGGYGGFFVEELARWVRAERPELLQTEGGAPREELLRLSVTLMMMGVPGVPELAGIRPVLERLGVEFDAFVSEEGLHRWGRVELALARLEREGRLRVEEDGAVVFVAGEDDDKDRVLRKRDGTTTYFASDVAYHDDKYQRGFDRLIDVWGADHHGYVARTRAAIEAMGRDPSRFEVLLFQLVKLVRGGEVVKMGKRRGTLITLQEVMEEIDEAVGHEGAGRDALRYFFLARRADTPITLDVDLAKKQEAENPVFYVQYGHARLSALLRRAEERFGWRPAGPGDDLGALLDHPRERAMLGHLGRWPAVLEAAAAERAPHQVVLYVQTLAQEFQSYYTELRRAGDSILPPERSLAEGWEAGWDVARARARLAWVLALKTVYASALGVLGIRAPDRMVRPPDDEAEGD